MSVKPILLLGNPKLRLTSTQVVLHKDNYHEIINDLKDTLHFLKNKFHIGRAIAAAQIGILKRIIYMEQDSDFMVMINPTILEKGNQKFEVWDSCYSANVSFFGKTIRHKSIKVEYVNENAQKVIQWFENDLSELFQHEIDHLNGILFTDRIKNNEIIMRSEWERLKLNVD